MSPLAVPAGGGDNRYSLTQIAKLWQLAGGSTEHWIPAVAVALAESGGDANNISPSHDYGLWQINQIHFGDGIIDRDNWNDPEVNAREAIKLSGNGTNWAAWCTAWTDPDPNCGHGYLPAPQAGSPAGRQLTRVAAALGGYAQPAVKPSESPQRAAVHSAWSYVGWWLGTWNPGFASESADSVYWAQSLRRQ